MAKSASELFGGAPEDVGQAAAGPVSAGGFSSASDLFGGTDGGQDDGPVTPVLTAPEAPKEEAGFFEGVQYGVKEAANPFSIDKGEQTRALSSGSSTVGYLLGNLGTSLGMNAALTAATGGIAAPLAGAKTAATAKNIATGLYALYQGLGRDRIRTQEEGRSWKPLDGGRGTASAILTSALELNPLLKASGKLNAALRVGAQAAGEAGYEKLHGGDNKDALFAAALGTVGAGIPLAYSIGKGKAVEAVAKDVAEDALSLGEALRTETPEIFTKAQAKLKELGGLDRPETPSTEFKRFLVGDRKAELGAAELEKAFEARASRLGGKKLDEAFGLMQAEKAYGAAAGEALADNLQKLSGFKEPNFAERLLKPMFYVARDVDRVTGLDTAKMVDKFAQAHNRHNTIAKRFTDRLLPLQKKAKELGLTGEEVTELMTMEDDGAFRRVVSKIGQPAADDFRKKLGEVVSGDTGLLGYLKDLGYNPAQRQNYMPMKAISGTRMASVLQGEAEKLETALKGRSLQDIRVMLERAEGQGQGALDALRASDDAARIVSLFDRVSDRIGLSPMKNVQDFKNIQDKLLSGGRFDASGIPDSLGEVSALFARKGDVPGEIRETDAWKLLAGYINENLRAAHFEDALNYGRLYSSVLDKLGMKKTAKLFEDYVTDQAGGARGLNGVMRKLNAKMEFIGEEKLRKKVNKWDAALGQAMKGAPEFASWLNSQIYPAKLALNMPGIIRNSTQFLATTVPELGPTGIYGTKKAAAAAASILGDDPNKWKAAKKSIDELKAKGLLSDHGRLETSDFAKAFGGVKGTIDKANETLFKWYQGTDSFNRVLTWRMGREVAADLLKGQQDAVRFASRLDSATKQQLRQLMEMKDGPAKLDAVHDLIGRYLISKTQFDYSNANKAEWARLAGPLFSMFTTWPGMVASDIAEGFKDKGMAGAAKKVATKYLPFYGLAMLAEKAVTSSDSDAAKYLFNDMTSYAPMDAIIPSRSESTGRGGPISNPLVEMGGKAGKAFIQSFPGVKDGEYVESNPGAMGRLALTEVLPTYVPIVAPVLNEIDRYSRIVNGKKKTSEIADNLGLEAKRE